MSSSGPNNPGTAADDASVGTRAWASTSNIFAEDGATAAASSNAPNQTTHYLKATNFSFAIPSTATINGILIEIKRRYQNIDAGPDPLAVDNRVRIIKADGAIGTTDKASASTWPSSLAYETYGGATDLWDETWTPTDINDSDFGVALSALCPNANGDDIFMRVDHVRITVYYTLVATNATQDCVGSLTVGGGAVLQAQKQPLGGMTVSGTNILKPTKFLTGTLSPSSVLRRSPQKLLSSLLSFSATMTTRIFRRIRKLRARVTLDRGPSAVVKVKRRQ